MTSTITIGELVLQHPMDLSPKTWIDDMKKWPKTESPHIIMYLVNSKACDLKAMSAFRSLESYNYLKSGWVGQVLVHEDHKNKLCFLKAQITPSQALANETHAAWICAHPEGEILTAGCSCMAGLGKACSHIGAILWKIDHANRKGYTGTTCTDVGSTWNSGTKRNIEPMLIKDVVFKKAKIGTNMDSTLSSSKPTTVQLYDHKDLEDHMKTCGFSELVNVRGTLLNYVVNTKIIQTIPSKSLPTIQLTHKHENEHVLPFACPPCFQFYEQYICMSTSKIKDLELSTRNQSCSQLWIESRLFRITASTASKVPKTDKGNPEKFLHSHIYKPFSGNENTRHGIKSEPVALAQFQIKTGLAVTKCGNVVAEGDTWLSASPDGLIGDSQIIEIKCPVQRNFNVSKMDIREKDGTYQLNPKGSRGYYTQIQLTMYCLKRNECFFYVWLSKQEDILIKVQLDDVFLNSVLSRLRKFYNLFMLPKLVNDVNSGRFCVGQEYKKFIGK